jgi:carboxylesterase
MTWHGQINRTIWEIEQLLEKNPKSFRLRRELLRTHFLQRYEFDRTLHVPRDDRSFLFLQDRQSPATLLLHGAAGTPAEMRDLGSFLYGKGLTVYCPRLSRFDVKNRPVSWESWVTMAENALTTMFQYSRQTAVIGLSLGGTIAMTLEQLHPLKGMVLLAPAIYTRMGIRERLLSLARYITPTLFYRFAGWNGEVAKAMDHVRRNVTTIKSPTLVLQARDDHIISRKGLKVLRKWIHSDSSDVVLLPEGSHALARGKAKEDVFERILQFAQQTQLQKRRNGRRQAGPRRSERHEGEGQQPDSKQGARSGPRSGQPRGSRGGRRRRRGGARGSAQSTSEATASDAEQPARGSREAARSSQASPDVQPGVDERRRGGSQSRYRKQRGRGERGRGGRGREPREGSSKQSADSNNRDSASRPPERDSGEGNSPDRHDSRPSPGGDSTARPSPGSDNRSSTEAPSPAQESGERYSKPSPGSESQDTSPAPSPDGERRDTQGQPDPE